MPTGIGIIQSYNVIPGERERWGDCVFVHILSCIRRIYRKKLRLLAPSEKRKRHQTSERIQEIFEKPVVLLSS